MEPQVEISRLIVKFLEGTLTPHEAEQLNRWIAENDRNKKLWRQLTDPKHLQTNLKKWESAEVEQSWGKLQFKIKSQAPASRFRISGKIFRYAAVVAAISLTGLGVKYVLSDKSFSAGERIAKTPAPQILPHGKIAQLVLGNGTVVHLDGNKSTPIIEEDGTEVYNDQQGVHYSSAKQIDRKEIYNTLIVPRSGEYRVVLSDGTKVWLNAASSLKYPTRFGNKERRVILSGEGYFEVAKDAQRPFRVETENAQVEVLGTKFNVSAYTEDAKNKISLAEGSVVVKQLNENNEPVVLKPGYGAVVEKDKSGIQTAHVNLEADLAWKDAMFVFQDEALGSIMKKLSRWYDVTVDYEPGVDTMFHFTGYIEKYENLANVLHLLELTRKVSFALNDHTVKVVLYKETTKEN